MNAEAEVARVTKLVDGLVGSLNKKYSREADDPRIVTWMIIGVVDYHDDGDDVDREHTAFAAETSSPVVKLGILRAAQLEMEDKFS